MTYVCKTCRKTIKCNCEQVGKFCENCMVDTETGLWR